MSSKSKRQNNTRIFLFNSLLVIISLGISIGVGEIILRINGHAPGFVPKYVNKKFRPVEHLVISENYYTDDEGVFKANPAGDWLPGITLNSDGFRSIEFENPEDGTTSILLLGDSFAWGASADPISESFAEIISREGYRLFNTGIAGTDPKQYAYLAEKYIPQLKPDIVAVALYIDNDIHPYRPMLPNKNLIHVTNVGWLQAFDHSGRYMTPHEAYQRYLGEGNAAAIYLNDNSKTFKSSMKKLFLKSAVGTNLLLMQAKLRFSPERFVGNEGGLPSRQSVQSEAREYLLRIKRAAEAGGAKFLLFVIPVHPKLRSGWNSIEGNVSVFDGLVPFRPDNLEISDYMKLPNAHFNNSGHKKYAQFMLQTIKAQTESE
ncbi:MAG: hypothetical protein K9K37_01265 [Desulfocapsa sp.]|nr:hypothetical protein [Desulfocapsa sp.]